MRVPLLVSAALILCGCSMKDSRPPLMWSFDENLDAIEESRDAGSLCHGKCEDGGTNLEASRRNSE